MNLDILNIKNLSKVYDGKVAHKALADIDLTIEEGEFVGIMGPSGSGKSTLLNMVATIDQPTSGSLIVNGKDPLRMKHNDLALFRRRELGFIFQDFNLLPHFDGRGEYCPPSHIGWSRYKGNGE